MKEQENGELTNGNIDTQEIDFGTEKISKLFMTIVMPSILAMVIMGAQGMIDGLFLGNYVNANAMASVNIAFPFLQIGNAFGMVISIGGTTYMGRMLGAGNQEKAKDIFKTCFVGLLVSGVILFIAGYFFSTPISIMLGANEVLLEDTSTYIKYVGIFLPPLLLYFLCSFVNRIIGKPNLFLIGTIVSIVANILLNFLFIVHWELGVTGAACATGFSYLIGFLINIPPIFNKKTVVNLFEGKFNMAILGRVVYNGSSEGVTAIATGVTTFVFNLSFMHYYGEAGVSAFTIISYIAQMTNSIMFGVVDGTSPIISYNFGAELHDRVKTVMKITVIINVIIGIVACVLIYVFGEPMIGMFASGDQELIDLTYSGAKLYSLMFVLGGVNILISSYFTAVDQALKSILISASRGLIFIIIGVLVLPNIFGVNGVWLVAPFADLVTIIICYVILKKEKSLI